ncbi:type IV secretory system conjugative DNA transfer family protein [Mesomycoplasma ovipneumoniae]|uniref:type IV secretory system conjugative DNA transfer family protein n=2 Tax=Mesomycoplasma ovipneumoniae TaxID=29562 RepID=UPI0028A7D000|nr:type IV secretory system conjugative DNA transfer family protein [Mesomycoplasma ovipneumoniae]WNM15155.1 type IV secretory system conjugative DNA transfer family protein [Mesomycoplasma ovipneumoniae]
MKLEQFPKALQKIIIAIISFVAPFLICLGIWPWIFAKKFNPIKNIFNAYYSLILDWKEIVWILLIAFLSSFIFYFIIHFFERHNKKLFSKDLNKTFLLFDEIEKIGCQTEFKNLFLVQKEKKLSLIKKDKSTISEKSGWVIKTELVNRKTNEVDFYVCSNSHAFILGDTRSGKTQKFIIPTIKYNIHLKDENKRPNLMVIDPKGELFTSLSEEIEKQGYEIVLLDFQNLGKSRGINFLSLIWDKFHSPYKTEAEKLQNYDIASNWLQKTIESIHEWDNNSKDSFWSKQAQEIIYIIGWYLLLYSNIDKTFTKEKYVFANFAYFLSLHNFVKGPWIEICKNSNNKELFSFYNEKIAQFISTNPDTLTSILVNAYGAISKFNSIGLKMFSSKDQTNFDELVQQSDPDFKEKFNSNIKPFSVFITFQLDSNIGQLMIPSIINNCYSSLISIANSKPNRRNFRDFLFLGDEFGNLPSVYQMGTKMSTAASYGIYFALVLQNIQQLAKYGKENDTILSNSALKIYFRSNDIKSIETFVKFAGKKDVIKKSYSNSEKPEKSNQTSNSETVSQENIISVNKLAQMPPEESWVFVTGLKPIHIKSNFAYEIWNHPQKSLESFYENKQVDFNFDFIEFDFEKKLNGESGNFINVSQKNILDQKELDKTITEYSIIYKKYFKKLEIEKSELNNELMKIIDKLKNLVDSTENKSNLVTNKKVKSDLNFKLVEKIEKEINSLNLLLNSDKQWVDDSYKSSIKNQIVKKEIQLTELKNQKFGK